MRKKHFFILQRVNSVIYYIFNASQLEQTQTITNTIWGNYVRDT